MVLSVTTVQPEPPPLPSELQNWTTTRTGALAPLPPPSDSVTVIIGHLYHRCRPRSSFSLSLICATWEVLQGRR
ncbi:hypothetical protein Hanom_Chr02g00152231 [Helianthus anomalus]